MNIKDVRALVTGGSSGIGKAIAKAIIDKGGKAAICGRDEARLEAAATEIGAVPLHADVSVEEQCAWLVNAAMAKLGGYNVLVNNAGYAVKGTVEEIPLGQMQDLFDVNFFGMIRLIQAVTPHMRLKRSGRIINLSSIAGRLSTPVNGPYSASKFAVEALSDALRLELGSFNIDVVLIEPAGVNTQFQSTAGSQSRHLLADTSSPYGDLYRKSEQFAARMGRNALDPGVVSGVIQRAIEATRPQARYLVGVDLPAKAIMYLGHSTWDRVLRSMFKVEQA
jgi:NAD(P)-dependent dehydrogenase (short-subunit alcohol dehydrogenase family)